MVGHRHPGLFKPCAGLRNAYLLHCYEVAQMEGRSIEGRLLLAIGRPADTLCLLG